MRAVPLLVESCEVGDGPINGLVWFATTALPASSALPSRPPGAPAAGRYTRRNGPVRCPSRHRRVPVVRRVTAPARGLDHGGLAASTPTRKGRPAASAGRRAGPTKGGWVGLEKRKARRGASAELLQVLFPLCDFCCLFSPQGSRFECGPSH